MTGRYDKLLKDWPGDVPFERVVRQRIAVLDELVEQGVTWSAISAALTRVGLTQRDGSPLNWRQVNAVYLRSRRTTRLPRSEELDFERADRRQKKPAFVPPSQTRTAAMAGGSNSDLAIRLAEARTLSRQIKDQYEE